MPSPPSRPRARGFTLIELLVVIAIIAILAGILFPVFVQAREKARQTSCMSNLRQMSVGAMQYIDDYDEAVVPWTMPTGQPANGSRRDDRNLWVHLIQPYVRNGDPPRLTSPVDEPPRGIFRCPSFNAAQLIANGMLKECEGPASAARQHLPAKQYYAHYGLLTYRTGGACTQASPYFFTIGNNGTNLGATPPEPLVKIALIRRPSEMILMSEGYTALTRLPADSLATTGGCVSSFSHNEGSNYIFVDGHARWMKKGHDRQIAQDASGCWYYRYLSADRE
jgi:prepilin-type N-terminal cleavage/methylation domain-containing protein/prepilin-type processing-associated H-X9-DG protein